MNIKQIIKEMKSHAPVRGFQSENYCDAYKETISILEKQISVKPASIQYGKIIKHEMKFCPYCKERVENTNHRPITYCSQCGQVIDWN